VAIIRVITRGKSVENKKYIFLLRRSNTLVGHDRRSWKARLSSIHERQDKVHLACHFSPRGCRSLAHELVAKIYPLCNLRWEAPAVVGFELALDASGVNNVS